MKPEAALQRSVCEYLALMCPDVLFWSSSNGLHIGSGANRFAHIANAKATGMKNGVPDLQLMWRPARMLLLELKAPKGRLSGDQMAMHGRLRLLGFEVDVIHTLDELRASIRKHAVPCRDVLLGLAVTFTLCVLQ